MKYKLFDLLTEYKEINSESLYEPVAVGRYGIRKRSEIYKKDLSQDYSKNKVIRESTLIIGLGSVQIDVGVLSSNEVFSVSPAYHTYKINTKIVHPRFLEYVFAVNNKRLFNKYSVPTARQGKKVDLKSMFKEMVEIPDFATQDIFVKNTLSLRNMIEVSSNELSLLDELIKSRFVSQEVIA